MSGSVIVPAELFEDAVRYLRALEGAGAEDCRRLRQEMERDSEHVGVRPDVVEKSLEESA